MSEGIARGIVTISVKSLYQKTLCFSRYPRHKIHLASNGNAIN
ncbi:hypothetical protein [Pseudomonas xanthosomatis]